jgi:hypothetical protein
MVFNFQKLSLCALLTVGLLQNATGMETLKFQAEFSDLDLAMDVMGQKSSAWGSNELSGSSVSLKELFAKAAIMDNRIPVPQDDPNITQVLCKKLEETNIRIVLTNLCPGKRKTKKVESGLIFDKRIYHPSVNGTCQVTMWNNSENTQEDLGGGLRAFPLENVTLTSCTRSANEYHVGRLLLSSVVIGGMIGGWLWWNKFRR